MLRLLTRTDLNAILEIERLVHIVPWTEETFEQCFDTGYVGWAVELEKKMIGFIIVALRPNECHVLNLCVRREYQRNGYGRQLLEYALTKAKDAGAGIAYLEVRRSNIPAISLYRKTAFHLVGERKHYYPSAEGTEDALVFAKSLRSD